MERSETRNVLLEYCAVGHHFHYNIDRKNRPNEYYVELGWCTIDEADAFCRVVQPFLNKKRYDSPDIANEVVKESWDEFCDMIEHEYIKT